MNDRTYDVVLFAYCGMRVDVATDVDRADAIDACRSVIRRARRNGRHVSKIGKAQFEIETPDGACMVADSDGVLLVRARRRSRR